MAAAGVAAAGAAPAASTLTSGWACEHHRSGNHDVFLSYRVASEAELVMAMARAIEAMPPPPGEPPIKAFVDKTCLNGGEDWEFALHNGLQGATLAVLLISGRTLQGIRDNARKSRDNVLMEYEIALELNDQRKAMVLPIFIGRVDWNEASYPAAPHVLSGKDIRATISRIFKLNGVKYTHDDAAGSTRAVLARVAEMLASKERYERRMEQRRVFEDEQLQGDMMWSRVKRVLDKNDVIGRGASSVVYRGDMGGRSVAVKALTVSETEAAASAKRFRTELQIMMELEHPNCAALIHSLIRNGGKERYLVMENQPNGSLEVQLFGGPEVGATGLPDWQQRLRIAQGICEGLIYLHSRDPKILHRDIKPDNVLLGPNMEPRICDFGVSRLAPELDCADGGANATHVATMTYVATRGFDAPECAYGHYSAKTDIYALGILLMECATGLPAIVASGRGGAPRPLPRHVDSELEAGRPPAALADARCQWPAPVAEGLLTLGRRCASDDRDARPTLSEIKAVLSDLLAPDGGASEFGKRPEKLARVGLDCQFCCERPRQVLFIPCGHVLACAPCAAAIKVEHGSVKCPYCRVPVQEMKPVAGPVLQTFVGGAAAAALAEGLAAVAPLPDLPPFVPLALPELPPLAPVVPAPSWAERPQPAAFHAEVAPEASLQEAIAACPAGGALLLRPGTHRGPIVLDKEVHLHGRGEATIEAADVDVVSVVGAADGKSAGVVCSLTGLTLRAVTRKKAAPPAAPRLDDAAAGAAPPAVDTTTPAWAAANPFGALVVQGAGRLALRDCRIESAGRRGAEITGGVELALTGTTFADCLRNGLNVGERCRADVRGCALLGSRYSALSVFDGGELTLVGSQVADGAGVGLNVFDGAARVHDCELRGHGAAAVQAHAGGELSLTGSRVHANACGLRIKANSRARVESCELWANREAAIEVEAGADPLVLGCVLREGLGVGLLLSGRGRYQGLDIWGHRAEGVEVVGPEADPVLVQSKVRDGLSIGLLFREGAKGTLKDLQIYRNAKSGIEVQTESDPKVAHCVVRDQVGPGIFVREFGTGTISHNTIRSNAGGGIKVQSGGDPVCRGNNISANARFGVLFTMKGRGKLQQNQIVAQVGVGVEISGRGDPLLLGNLIRDGASAGVLVTREGRGRLENNDIMANALAGLEISTGGDPLCLGTRISDGLSSGVHSHSGGRGRLESCLISQNRLSNVEISLNGDPVLIGCRVYDGQEAGIHVHEGGRGRIEGVELFGHRLAAVSISRSGDPLVTGCIIRDGRSAGVVVSTDGKGRIQGTQILGNRDAAIEIKTGGNPHVTNCKIHDNYATGAYVHARGRGVIEECEIFANDHACLAIAGPGSDPHVVNCELRDGRSDGVFLSDCDGGRLERCRVFGHHNDGIDCDNSTTTIIDCVVSGNVNCGIRLHGPESKGSVERCDLSDCGAAGVQVQDGAMPTLKDLQLHGNHGDGARFEGVGAGGLLATCTVRGNEGAGVAAVDGASPEIADCQLSDGKAAGLLVRDGGRAVARGTTIRGHKLAGVHVFAGGHATLNGCVIQDGKASGVTIGPGGAATLTANNVSGNAASGLDVHRGAAGPVLVANNTFEGNRGRGVRLRYGTACRLAPGANALAGNEGGDGVEPETLEPLAPSEPLPAMPPEDLVAPMPPEADPSLFLEPAAFYAEVGPEASLQEAIAACPAGGALLLRPGTHRGPIVLDKEVHLYGRSLATIAVSEEGVTAVTSEAAVATLDSVIVRVDVGPKGDLEAAMGIYVKAGGLRLHRVDTCCLAGPSLGVAGAGTAPVVLCCKIHGSGSNGALLTEGSGGYFRDVEFFGSEWPNVCIYDRADPTLVHCRIYDGRNSGLWIGQGGQGRVFDCAISGHARAGVEVSMRGTCPWLVRLTVHAGLDNGVNFHDHATGWLIDSHVHSNAGMANVLIGKAAAPTILGCHIADSADGAAGLSLRSDCAGRYEGNDISGSSGYGVELSTLGDALVINNRIHHNRRAGVAATGPDARGRAEGNTIEANAGPNVQVDSGADPVFFRNVITGGPAVGVYVLGDGCGRFEENRITVAAAPADGAPAPGSPARGAPPAGVYVHKSAPVLIRNVVRDCAGRGLWLHAAPTAVAALDGNELADNAGGNCEQGYRYPALLTPEEAANAAVLLGAHPHALAFSPLLGAGEPDGTNRRCGACKTRLGMMPAWTCAPCAYDLCVSCYAVQGGPLFKPTLHERHTLRAAAPDPHASCAAPGCGAALADGGFDCADCAEAGAPMSFCPRCFAAAAPAEDQPPAPAPLAGARPPPGPRDGDQGDAARPAPPGNGPGGGGKPASNMAGAGAGSDAPVASGPATNGLKSTASVFPAWDGGLAKPRGPAPAGPASPRSNDELPQPGCCSFGLGFSVRSALGGR